MTVAAVIAALVAGAVAAWAWLRRRPVVRVDVVRDAEKREAAAAAAKAAKDAARSPADFLNDVRRRQ